MSFIDNQTFDELNIIRNKYSSKNLIDLIDETVTSEGKQNLINHLRFPMVSLDEIKSFQRLITNINENIDNWTPFQDLLLSDAYSKIIQLKQKQLVHFKPLLSFEYSYFSPQKYNPNYLFLKELHVICKNLFMNTEVPMILREMNDLISEFTTILDKKERIKYTNWYCLNYKYKEFSRLLEFLYRIDSYVSIAKSHVKLNLKYPEWINWGESEWGFKNLTNLLINKAVSNDFSFQKYTKVVFLTGPNMAGKSSLMTSFGQAIYMARCGLGVPALKAVIPWAEHIFTAFESSTSIEEGLSYFASEVKRSINGIESTLKSNFSILLIDELFKGTNILDSQDCLNFFLENLKKENSFCIVATHLIDYVEFNKNNSNTEYFNFEGNISENNFVFDYKLKKGISIQRLGIYILKMTLSKALTSNENKI